MGCEYLLRFQGNDEVAGQGRVPVGKWRIEVSSHADFSVSASRRVGRRVDDLFDDGRQFARCDSKFLRRLKRLRLKLKFERAQLYASTNSLKLDLNVHERIVSERERWAKQILCEVPRRLECLVRPRRVFLRHVRHSV